MVGALKVTGTVSSPEEGQWRCRIRTLGIAESREIGNKSRSDKDLCRTSSSGTLRGHSEGKLRKEITPPHHYEPRRFKTRVGFAGLRFWLSISSPSSSVLVVGGRIQFGN